jgi:hypothetical protein
MRSAAAHMIPNTPRYVSPKEQAENRARLMRYGRRRDPGLVALMMFGYSD